MVLGQLRIKNFLQKTLGQVRGTLVSDAKRRWYAADYQWDTDASQRVIISRADGTGDVVQIPPVIDLDESLIAFLGFIVGMVRRERKVKTHQVKSKCKFHFHSVN